MLSLLGHRTATERSKGMTRDRDQEVRERINYTTTLLGSLLIKSTSQKPQKLLT